MSEEDDENRRADTAYGALKQLSKAIRNNLADGLEGDKAHADKAILAAMTQHQNHLAHHSVAQKDTDPYKIVCWFGCYILKEVSCHKIEPVNQACPFRAVANALVDTLAGMLAYDSREKVILPSQTRLLLVQMLIAEKLDENDQGIWQNGLYAAFHCSVSTLRALTDSK